MSTRRRIDRAALSLVLIAIAAGYGQFGAVASLDEVAKHFGQASTSSSLAGVAGLSFTVLGMGLGIVRLASLFALPLTSLADRLGRKLMLRRVAIAGLLLTALASLSPSYWAFVACFAFARPLLTASTTLVQVISVEISSPRRRVQRLSWIAAGAGAGAGFSAMLHGLLPGANAFRVLFATAFIPALLVTPLLKFVREPDARLHHGDELRARLGSVPRAFRGEMMIVATLIFVIGMITGPANGFAFRYGEGILKISRHEVAFVVFISAVSGLLGLVVGARLANRIGRRWTVALGTIAVALTSTLAYSGGASRFIAGYLFGVFAAALLAPAASALTNETFPHSIRATTAGWVVVAGVVGAIMGLVVFGLVGDAFPSATSTESMRLPAMVTFLPALPLLLLLRRLPETRGVEIT